MTHINQYKHYFYNILILYFIIILFFNIKFAFSKNESEIIISADEVEISDNGNIISANGNILIESKKLLSSSDMIVYNKNKDEISALGNIIIKDNLNNYYYFDSVITDKQFNNAIGINTKIRLSDNSRIAGREFSRVNSSINQINNALYTPCLKKNYALKSCPGWKVNAKKVIHDSNKQNVYYEGAVLSVLNVPILYSPFFSHPDPTVDKRSGLLMPSISNDNNLGTTLSLPYFFNLSSNYDLTFTPTIQSLVDDYYSVNYRHLTENHRVNIDSSISSNESKTGTKNHIFIDGEVRNPFGSFGYNIQTSNNDTYLRKNHINFQTILESGIFFTKEMDNSYLDFNAYIYKHLNNRPEQKWEYIYPNLNYDIYDYKDPIYGLDWSINNSFLNYKDINKNFNQQVTTEILSKKILVSRKTGLKFENTIQNRFVYFNSSLDNFNQLRIFPQLASKISFPLSKTLGSKTEILEPIIMPILAPYNNYSNNQTVTSSNVFSLNRETSNSLWESGPRINYGINWLMTDNNTTINTSIGQSARINKDSRSKVSNYFIGNTLDFGSNGYIKTDITIDRENLYLKDNNINTSIAIGALKFGIDYDYETSNKIRTSEQISFGAKINFIRSTDLILSIRKDLMSDNNIGKAIGLHYEDDCLAINLDYFRDYTVINDIKNSRGISFNIVLKPFGTSKKLGKVKNFGPNI